MGTYKEFIPYAEALEMKELGFDEPCIASWSPKTKEKIPTLTGCGALYFDSDGLIDNKVEDILCSAPLYQQIFRWFREKFKMIEEVRNRGMYQYYCVVWSDYESKRDIFLKESRTSTVDTYEEAQLACLRELIKIVKNK